MNFGRHCVISIQKKNNNKKQQQQQQQQSLPMVVTSHVTITMRFGTVATWVNKEATATAAFNLAMTLNGVFSQLVAVSACGHDSRGS